jgi:transposase
MDRKTVAKILKHDKPIARKRRIIIRPTIEPHEEIIRKLASDRRTNLRSGKPNAAEIYRIICKLYGYTGGYDAVRRYVNFLEINRHPSAKPSNQFGYAYDVISTACKKDGTRFLQAMSQGRRTILSENNLRRFMYIAKDFTERELGHQPILSAEDCLRQWLNSVAVGAISISELKESTGPLEDLLELMDIVNSGNRIKRNRALSILALKSGHSLCKTSAVLGISRTSCRRYLRIYDDAGAAGLLVRKRRSNRKIDDEQLKEKLFAILHEPPLNYDINRTTWRMADLREILAQHGHPVCEDVLRSIIRNAGYRWCKARIVLTSRDPEYREKLKAIQDILSKLSSRELFFSIDEFGPFSVKMKGGRALVGPGETRVVPQWQNSKGCLILTAALELSTNQVTHFYSKKKNTAEMIKMMDVLVGQYPAMEKIFLSWDAASWHLSKKLQSYIDKHNDTCRSKGLPRVETAPLPSGAQFLNVIESVFSGMARAIIHNSNYASVDDAKAAIDRYFSERNDRFRKHPERAGKKIWGAEREPAAFSPSRNFKDPRYR